MTAEAFLTLTLLAGLGAFAVWLIVWGVKEREWFPGVLGAFCIATLAGFVWLAVEDGPSPVVLTATSKRIETYTTMLLVGKVMVPQVHTRYLLVTADGRKCDAGAELYAAIEPPSRVSCQWSTP